MAHGAAFEGGPEDVRETLPAPGPEGCQACKAPRLDWCVCGLEVVDCSGWRMGDFDPSAVRLTTKAPTCDVCGLDALSLKLIARNDRPRRRTLEVDGCRVAAYVCRVCEGKVEPSPSERGWSERTGFSEGVTGRGGPDDHKAQALGAEFSMSLAEALEGAEHGDHVREACCFDGWPGASAVWLGYALGRFLLWLQGAELRPLRDLAREAWDPHDEGAAPYFFDAGVRHG